MNEITGHYTFVRNYRTYYETAGTGQPVICLPMAGATGSEYRHFMESVPAGIKTITLDMPGHGKSLPDFNTMADFKDVDDYLDYVWEFIESLKLTKPVIIGAAMNANTALLEAARHCGEVKAVVAINGGIVPSKGYIAMFDDPHINFEEIKVRYINKFCDPNITREKLNECIWYGVRSQNRTTAAQDCRLFAELSVSGKLNDLKLPVLMLTGASDRAAENADGRNEILALPYSVEKVVEDAGHYLIIEQPEKMTEAILRFLNSTGISMEGAEYE